ncbi:putative nucleic-acid-binding protein containing a Zn-ribbon [Variovorax sp. SRS16]|uniref:Zn-ribbon domain-containing OB-fold protein n=1 Tax=Variovorax sp. SRS16 TaxID=282217 RepID=UPI001316713B|nr:Zn-ribbon domain-containing OB-fold protein [Variovorax sp. SRS16]VTU24406.1 putative nucleic-acid-binding protein containing a Zn-ribbon [Variovorax sp. SRS16]
MTTIARDRELPAPAISPENQPFFEGTAQGVLLLKFCDGCGRHHYYPRTICPHCFSDRTRWIEAKGSGSIYTFSVLRLGTPTPFALAYVKLSEGPTMMTNIVDCDLDALEIGMAVRLVCKPATDGTMIPMFTPGAIA